MRRAVVALLLVAVAVGGYVVGRGEDDPASPGVDPAARIATTTRPASPPSTTTTAPTTTSTAAPVTTSPTVTSTTWLPPQDSESSSSPIRCGRRYVSGCYPADDPIWDIEDELIRRDLNAMVTTTTVCGAECTDEIIGGWGSSSDAELEERIAELEDELDCPSWGC